MSVSSSGWFTTAIERREQDRSRFSRPTLSEIDRSREKERETDRQTDRYRNRVRITRERDE